MKRHFAAAILIATLSVPFFAGQVLAQGINTTDPVLPPLDGKYRTAADAHADFNGAGFQIILRNIEHQALVRLTNLPVGADEQETFTSSLSGNIQLISGGIDQGTVPTSGSGPVTTLVHGKTGNVTGTFNTEMLLMNLTGSSAFGSYMIRESPTLPSLGQTSITNIGGGLYHIDSFFDVFTELSVDGGATWIPDSHGPAHVELGPLVPEPASAVLLAVGVLGIAGLARRPR
jgi:hypothetical protein